MAEPGGAWCLWGRAESAQLKRLSSSSISSVGKVKQAIYSLHCLLWRSLWASALFWRIPHAFVDILYTKWPVLSCSVVSDSATPWTLACQVPLSTEFSRQEYWSGLPWSPPGHLPDPGIELASLMSPALIGRWNLYHSSPLGSPESAWKYLK